MLCPAICYVVLSGLLSSAVIALKNLPPRPLIPKITDIAFDRPVFAAEDGNLVTLPPYDTWYYFDQLIDHGNPQAGTFRQRYYFTYEFYKPGGPIILCTPGEDDADGYSTYITNVTINGVFAQATHGAAVVIEHRFFGESNPYDSLTVDSLKYLTIDQAVDDLAYFSQNVKLPFPATLGANTTSDKAPWLLVGGSYAGALVSLTMVRHPDVFWAGYASSAVVQATSYNWGYFDVVRQFMPKNCSADLELFIDHVDEVFMSTNVSAQNNLKQTLGLGNVTHFDDIAGALVYPLYAWQYLQPNSGSRAFYGFCDAIEVKNSITAPEGGVGLDNALQALGQYYPAYWNSICGGGGNLDECLGTYSANGYYTPTTINNPTRSWLWLECNEFGFWQAGAPTGWPTIASRLVSPAWSRRQCAINFPEVFSATQTVDPAMAVNTKFKGWDVNLNRVFFANGKFDPWRETTLSSDFHFRNSTDSQPIAISNGYHCTDLRIADTAIEDQSVINVQALGVAYITKWIQEWQTANPASVSTGALIRNATDPANVQKNPPFIPASIPTDIINAVNPTSGLPSSTTATSSAPGSTSTKKVNAGSRRMSSPIGVFATLVRGGMEALFRCR